MTTDEKKYLAALEEKYSELKDSNYKIDKLPNLACTQENCFLKDNVDFYISYLFLYKNSMPDQKQTDRLLKHLNNCYWCFLDYSQVIKRYFHQVEELKHELGKRGS